MPGKVGFSGLGNMGGPMALNPARYEFSLVVHDIDPAKLEPLTAQGAAVEHSPAAVAASVQRTICMVETRPNITRSRPAISPRRELEIRRAAIGEFELCTCFRFGGMPYALAERSLRLYAKEVLPVLESWEATKAAAAAQ